MSTATKPLGSEKQQAESPEQPVPKRDKSDGRFDCATDLGVASTQDINKKAVY
ncbi:hypothetical protein L8R84_05965 [Vibrio splendidus]|uniref:hypothetical protein n=1 Tax=Vibrio splendidus TaxID=29497 RepID=UPI002469C076|nr:hypothetical protein [Vibrio splendidus]MDH5935687.1 hypothetical protein [Vibrio splendidus]